MKFGKGNFAIRHIFTLDDYQIWTISLNLTKSYFYSIRDGIIFMV